MSPAKDQQTDYTRYCRVQISATAGKCWPVTSFLVCHLSFVISPICAPSPQRTLPALTNGQVSTSLLFVALKQFDDFVGHDLLLHIDSCLELSSTFFLTMLSSIKPLLRALVADEASVVEDKVPMLDSSDQIYQSQLYPPGVSMLKRTSANSRIS